MGTSRSRSRANRARRRVPVAADLQRGRCCPARVSWPGNVRQLRTCSAERSLLRPHGPIDIESLPPNLALAAAEPRFGLIEQLEGEAILRTLHSTGGNVSKGRARDGSFARHRVSTATRVQSTGPHRRTLTRAVCTCYGSGEPCGLISGQFFENVQRPSPKALQSRFLARYAAVERSRGAICGRNGALVAPDDAEKRCQIGPAGLVFQLRAAWSRTKCASRKTVRI